MNLLVHSLSEFREIIFSLVEEVRPRRIVEIGSESGAFTAQLLDWCRAHDGKLVTIDPAPAPRVREMAAASGGAHELLLARSPAALEGLPAAELYVIDGDHNHWTVYNELRVLHETAAREEVAPLVLLHDVCWPCGRRDFYYSPADLPLEAVHPHTYEGGVDLDHEAPIPGGGFRGKGAFAVALHEGGPKNGVLTAIDDFRAEHPGYELAIVPAVFGLGILYPANHPHAERIAALVAPYDRNPFMARLEENRLRNYLQVIALQDRIAAVEAERDRAAAAKVVAEAKLAAHEERWYTRVGTLVDETLKRP